MRLVLPAIVAAVLLSLPQPGHALGQQSGPTVEGLLGWAYEYRSDPRPERIPEAVHAMQRLGVFNRPEGGGFFTGFIAGVLADNPQRAERLVEGMFPMPPKEQAVIVQSIAYSGLPDWRELLFSFRERMPEREPLIEGYLTGQLPTLGDLPLEEGPHIVYTLWGYYLATGDHAAVVRMFPALEWAGKRPSAFSLGGVMTAIGLSGGPDLTRMTTGSTAKWTLASHAERDRDLLVLYRQHVVHEPPEIAKPLQEVIEAAQDFEAERIREAELEVLEAAELRERRRGAPLGRAAHAGSVALSAACVIAGVTGHVEIAVPCVITGALYSGAMNLLQNGK